MGVGVDFFLVGEGSGDAICIQYGPANEFYLHVVDGGYTSTGEKLVKHIAEMYGANATIVHMVLSHADDDHAQGLIPVLQNYKVLNLWMNKPWDYAHEVIHHFHDNYKVENWIRDTKASHEYLVELEKIAISRNIPIHAPLQGAQIGPFTVLAPSRERYVSLIPDLDKTPPPYREEVANRTILGDALRAAVTSVKETLGIETLDANPPATSASNETSVVQYGQYDGKSMLLTADVGPEGLAEAARYASALGIMQSPDFVQVPHHGSRRNVSPAVLDAWLGKPNGGVERGMAMVSLGSKASDYPRKRVKNAFIRRGYPVGTNRDGWARWKHGYEKRPNSIPLTMEPFDPDVED